MERRAVVQRTIEQLRPRVHLDGDAASKYQDAVLERGQLDLVLAQSERALSNGADGRDDTVKT